MRLESWSGSEIGLVRKSNQDALGCFPALHLFVIADGMGGRAEGEVASRLAVETIRDALSAAPAAEAGQPPAGRAGFWRTLLGSRPQAGASLPDGALVLQTAIEQANERVFAAGHDGDPAPAQGAMGTTVVALFCAIKERRACWAHVGDSRLYRARGEELALLTADHTLLGEAFWEQANVPFDLPHSNRLVRAVGLESTVEVALGSDELRAGDLFLLCSDGISGMVKPDALQRELLKRAALADIGAELIRLALEAGGRDNASAVLVRVSEP